MCELEIFVKEASTDSTLKKVEGQSQVIMSDAGVIHDVSLHNSPYIRLNHLSMLHLRNGRKIPRELLPSVDTLYFRTSFARHDSVNYILAGSRRGDKLVKICLKEGKIQCGVLFIFIVQDADLAIPEPSGLYELIAISHSENINDWEELT
jgi:hypothetical protein